MSAEEQKPAVTTEAGAVEPTPAPAGVVGEEKPAEAVEPKREEAPKTEGETAAPAEEKKEKPVEPIYSGALGYKAPGLKNAFRFSKKYFWFSEDPIPASSLGHYLRGEKPEVAHPVAAWSSVTGKGLLYFVKHADQKETPAGVLNLADATELTKDGTIAFHFKLPGGKHTFEANTASERNGWFVAVEKTIEEAKAAKESIVSSDSYKEQLEKLGKPAALVATAAKDSSTPKKSTDATPKPAEGEAAAATDEGAAPARTGSSSSSSSDENKKKKKKAKSKSRSVSRGKRASFFSGILGKKEKAEEKVEEKTEKAEEKVEEKKEDKKEEPGTTGEPSTAAPVVAEEAPKPAEEAKAEEPSAEDKKEEKKPEEKPKPTKRGSIFGNFVEKLKSPTHEKKESEVAPAAPANEPQTAEAPKTEETSAAPVSEGTAEAPKTEEAKPAPTTPHKEKQPFSFGKFLGGGKEKMKSPTTEKAQEAPKSEEPPKVEETAAPAEAAAEQPKEEPKEEKKEEPAAEAPATKKRGSIFGNLGGSVKKEGEEKHQGLKGLFRNTSKAGRSKKEKEATSTPAKVEETAEPKEKKTEAAPVEAQKETPAAPAAPAEQAAIGDVVPDAVTVGQAPKSTPEVATTA